LPTNELFENIALLKRILLGGVKKPIKKGGTQNGEKME